MVEKNTKTIHFFMSLRTYATTPDKSIVTDLMRTGMRPLRCSPRITEFSSAMLNITSSFLKLLSSKRRSKFSLQPNVSIGKADSYDISSLH